MRGDEAKRLIGEGPELTTTGTALDAIRRTARDPETACRLATALQAAMNECPAEGHEDRLVASAAFVHAFIHRYICGRQSVEEDELSLVRELRAVIGPDPLDARRTIRVISGLLLALAEGLIISEDLEAANERECAG